MDETPGAISDGAPQPLDTERDFEFKPAVQSFKCPTCPREFGKEQALQTHIIRAHKKFWSTNSKRPRKSAAASKPRYEKYRDRYRAKGLNARGQPYKKGKLECPICRQSYANRDSLRTHIRAIHQQSTVGLLANAKPGRKANKALPKTCPVCSRTFSTRAIMGHHLRSMHRKSMRDFPELNARGASPNGALQHEPGKKPKHKRGAETCPICKRDFAKAYIYAHVRNQHGMTLTKARAAANTPATPAPVAAVEKQPAQTAEHARHVTFCPICGTNIANVQTAVNFGG